MNDKQIWRNDKQIHLNCTNLLKIRAKEKLKRKNSLHVFFIIHKKSKLFKTSNRKIIMNATQEEDINTSPITSAIPTLAENLKYFCYFCARSHHKYLNCVFVDQAQKNFVTQLLQRQHFDFEKFHQRIKKVSRINRIQVPTVDLTESSTDESDTDRDESMGEEDQVADTFINHTVRDVTKASTDTADHPTGYGIPLPILAVNESVISEDNALEYNIRDIMIMLNNEDI